MNRESSTGLTGLLSNTVYILVNIYFIYLLNARYYLGKLFFEAGDILMIVWYMMWFIALLIKSTELLIASYVFSTITASALYGFDQSTTYSLPLAVVSILILDSVSKRFKQKVRVEESYRFKELTIGVSLQALIILVYIGLAFLTVYALNEYYEAVVESTPEMFQRVYSVLVDTRIGALLLAVVTLIIVHYMLRNYVRDTITDLVLAWKGYAYKRLYSLVRSEARDTVKLKDFFTKYYFRSILFFTMYFLYGILYPILEYIFPNMSIPLFILWGLLWFFSSLLVYGLLKRFLKRFFEEPWIPPEPPRRSYWGLVFSSILLTAYLLLIVIYAPNSLLDVLYSSMGLRSPVESNEGFLGFISDLYLNTTYHLYSLVESYGTYLSNAYSFLDTVVNDLFKLLWGG